MNRHPVTGKRLEEKALRTAFATDAYNLLIVASKYQTGFDQPLLAAMSTSASPASRRCRRSQG